MSGLNGHRTRVGNLTVTVLPLGEICDRPRDWFDPAMTAVADGVHRLPVNCLHVAGAGWSVLLDACDPIAYPSQAGPVGDIRAALSHADIDPNTITHVILSHGHHDHFSGVRDRASGKPNFPDARHILSVADWNGSTLTDEAQKADGSAADPCPIEMLHGFGLLDLDETTTALPSDIILIDAPGETRGHRVVQIASQGQSLYFFADLFHLPAEIDDPHMCPLWADQTALLDSRRQITTAIRAANARFICSHIPQIFTPDRFPDPPR